MFPFLKTLNSFNKAKLAGIIIFSLIWAVVLISFSAGMITLCFAFLVNISIGWIDKSLNFVIGVLAGIGGWFMLPAMVPLIGGMFQEKVIHKVEIACYPDAARKKEPAFWPDFKNDIAFTIWAIFLNVLVLPFHFIGIGFLISILLNTYLLGREFFESAAGYHLGKADAKKLGRNNKKTVYTGGLVITILTLVPILNLFVPIFAIAWMVHVYHHVA